MKTTKYGNVCYNFFYHHFSDQHTDFSENHLTSEMS